MRSQSSRPLLSRSGCISWLYVILILFCLFVLVPFYRGAVVFWHDWCNLCGKKENVLVPFYRGAVVFENKMTQLENAKVLVPFYRGAVVFDIARLIYVRTEYGSRPLLSRSGCI